MSAFEQALASIGWINAESAHDSFLFDLFRELKSKELEPLSLSELQRETLVAQQFNARTQGYACSFPDARIFVKLEVGALMALLGPEIHLIDLTIAEGARNQGHGSELFRTITALGVPVTLSVFAENPARRLYSRLGFRETSSTGMHVEMRYE
ncbi:MAG: GNAT family N-acetyltransferase [Fimbriimonadaceae bacterium]